ncbi:polysaccharide deacetylase family protein [Flavobacterium sp. WC2421]|jgi:peptidoglycan-N-acetylglucosamine deacetylase|uniref:polysaccharide deacetylase family protein n=1 Tax=Flavobacterium sp. WC2421 TaxID=3234138 RepID=UPI0034679BDF
MSFYWIKTHSIIKKLFSKYIWDLPNTENKIYLTFDDGPTPEITKWVLAELKKHSVKATFFCIGKNIETNPAIFNQIINEGHAIGNHTFDHLKGWKTTTETYIHNVSLCADSISNFKKGKITLFRPPYGKIKSNQAKILKAQGYKIIMWDVLSADFDQAITKEKCLENVISNMKSGSIIVFHDSIKAFDNLKYTLPKVLDYIAENKLSCEVLE